MIERLKDSQIVIVRDRKVVRYKDLMIIIGEDSKIVRNIKR